MSGHGPRTPARIAFAAAFAAVSGTLACGRGGAEGSPRGISIEHAIAPAPIVAGDEDAASMAVYLTIRNGDALPDTLVAAESPDARSASLHGEMQHGEAMTMMMPVATVVAPARGAAELAPGGVHVMLEGLHRAIRAGDTISLTLAFARAGRIGLRIPVVRYDQLDSARATTRQR